MFHFVPARETLFVFGGSDGNLLESVEALSLSSSNRKCPTVSDIPYGVDRITAATIGGAPVLCGGYGGFDG